MPVTLGYPDSTTTGGNFNLAQWASIFDTKFKPQKWNEIVRRNGYGEKIFDAMQMANLTTPVKARSLMVYEEGDIERTVRIVGPIAVGAAGADIEFVVHADDRDAQNGVPIREDFSVVLPAASQASGEDRIYVVTDYDSATFTVTASPLSADGTVTESEVETAVAAGTRLKVHASYWGPGTGQPQGTTFDLYERNYYTHIAKESMGFEGGMGAIEWWTVETKDGDQGIYIKGQEQIEFLMNKQVDDAIFLNELNDNALLVQTSQAGGSNLRRSALGIWNHALASGQALDYAAGAITDDDLADVDDYLRSNNVTSTEVMCWYGPYLSKAIEDMNLDFIREFSGGTDLIMGPKKLGVDIKYFRRNGILFAFKSVASFRNPNRYGGSDYAWASRGLMYPVAEARVEYQGKKEITPTFMLGYLNNKGEDRTRIVRFLDGMTGKESIAVSQYDASNLYMLSEFMPLVFRPNQLITLAPE